MYKQEEERKERGSKRVECSIRQGVLGTTPEC